jgi:hypothetical protein
MGSPLPASSAAMVLLPTPDSWARLYWEKPRSSLSSRSLSGFLDAVLIFICSRSILGAERSRHLALRDFHSLLPAALDHRYGSTVEPYPEKTLRIRAAYISIWF